MTALIFLFGMDFTHPKLPYTVVNIPFFGWSLLMDPFFYFHHKFLHGFKSRLFCIPFLNKSFNNLCSVTRCIIILKNDFIIDKPIFYQWNKKIIQYFTWALTVELMIAISPSSLNYIWPHIMNELENSLVFFWQNLELILVASSSFYDSLNSFRHKFQEQPWSKSGFQSY